MNRKPLLAVLVVVTSVLLIGITTIAVGDAVIANDDDLLGKYETSNKEFKKLEIGDKIVYFHQRMIDGAIVEKDYITYQFDKNTKALLKKKIHWRPDLPKRLPAMMITKEQAEPMVKGKVQFTKLYIVSAESDVFPIKPTPKNPCWVVRTIDNNNIIVTIIDAVNGKILGYGVPPPYTGFSLSGPTDIANCTGAWDAWYKNAETWFNEMGYSTEAVKYPDEAKVKSHIQSTETVMFYELAHGDSYSFANSCTDSTTAPEIHDWIENYTKMPFTFIGSCGGMCSLDPGTLSYEFRKGSTHDTVTVGYCGMGTEECSDAWDNSVSWQDAMFNYMNDANTAGEAFDKAMADYPMCVGCMRFAGDENFAVVPVVGRVNRSPNTPSAPTGPDSGTPGTSYSFTATTTDPDGDRVAFKFDWGDGTQSDWTSYVDSGSSASKSHSWSTEGTYYVKVKAKDAYNAKSGWSGGHPMTIRAVVLEVDPPSLDFGEVGKGSSKIMSFRAYNAGGGTLSGTISVNRNWMTVSPTSFEGNDNTISVTIETQGLTEKLAPYTGTVTVTSNGGTKTIEVSVIVIPTGAVAYPNPFFLGRHTNLTFWGTGVPYAEIRIFTLAGELVKTLRERYGTSKFSWDARNEKGDKLARGIYIYVTKDSTGKIAVVK